MSDTPIVDAEIEDARNVALYYECRKNPKESDPPPLVYPAVLARTIEHELAAAKAEIERLQTENEALRKDALRVLTDQEAEIIKDIEVMAADSHRTFWKRAIAKAALDMLRRCYIFPKEEKK